MLKSLSEIKNFIPEIFDPIKHCYPYCNEKMAISGPPGTGKSYTLIHSFLKPCISDSTISTEEVLSCSFTKAAAKVLKERLNVEFPNIDDWKLRNICSTIHSEALKRFKIQFEGQAYSIIGEAKARTDEDDGTEGSSRFLIDLPPNIDIKEKLAIQIWDLARNKLITDITSKAFAELVQSVSYKANILQVREWITAYEMDKRKNKRLDLTDVLIAALRCPSPKRKLLIIDEFQDSSPLQTKLIKKWQSDAEFTIFAFDLDQSIFSFTGADVTQIFSLIEDGYTFKRLHISKRVPKSVHAVARKLILKNKERFDSPFSPMEDSGSVKYLTKPKALIELDSTIFDEDKDCFILARSSGEILKWSEELDNLGIPYINERGYSPWGSPVALAITRAILAIKDEIPLLAEDAYRLVAEFPGRDLAFFNSGTKKGVTVEILKTWSRSDIKGYELEKLGLNLKKVKETGLEELLTEFKQGDRAKDIPIALARSGNNEVLYKTPKIRLTSSHSSKGREADLVIVDLAMPWKVQHEVKKDERIIEEERRLLYVAITRTKSDLILVHGEKLPDLGTITGLMDDISVKVAQTI